MICIDGASADEKGSRPQNNLDVPPETTGTSMASATHSGNTSRTRRNASGHIAHWEPVCGVRPNAYP